METDEIRLNQLGRVSGEDNSNNAQNVGFSLPPADGGKDAWFFLTACFIVEALVWGFPFAFGVFQKYYASNALFKDSSNIAVIGTSCSGLMYLSAPLVFGAMQLYPRHRRVASVFGLLLMCAGLLAASFAQTVQHLIWTQGVMYALGGCILYSPTILLLDEWFIRRKGLAFGMMWAGTGISGVLLPLLFEWGLNKYGFRTMLRAWCIATLGITSPFMYFVKPRLPVAMYSTPRRFDLSFLKSATFLFLQAGNIIEGLGYFLPTIYLPTFAESVGISRIGGTVAVVLFNSASVLGCVAMGALVDRLHISTCILISTIGATVSVFSMWGTSVSLPVLSVFAIIYGLFAGSFSSTWTGVIREIRTQNINADSGMVFAFLAAGRGIGSVLSGPLSEALIRNQPWKSKSTLGYGTGYGSLVVFTGVTALLGGISWAGRMARMW